MLRTVALSSLFLACTALAAQQNNAANCQNQSNQARDGQNSRVGQEGQAGQARGADQHFATCIAYGNQEEVILGQLASEKSQNEEVKRFAEMMVKEHQQYLTKLQKFAPEAARQGALGSAGETRANDSDATDAPANKSSKKTPGADESNKDGGAQGRSSETQRDGAAGASRAAQNSSPNIMQVERELAEQCLKSARQKLESKTGADFDKCYIHAQVAKHGAMKDKLMVFQRHTSQELAHVFAEGLKTTEHHLVQAEEIAKSLDHGGTSGNKSTGKRQETRENK